MYDEYERIYLEYKKKNIIDLVEKFKKYYGNEVFSVDLKQDMFNFEEFLRPELCRDCGGYCCTNSPCLFAPSDFLDIDDIDYIRAVLDTGLVCISRVANGNALVFRPRGIEDSKGVYSYTFKRNQCILKGDAGCMLPAGYRPTQGLLYIPQNNDGCILHTIMYADRDCEVDYQQYEQQLRDLEYRCRNMTISNDINVGQEQVNNLIRRLIKYK